METREQQALRYLGIQEKNETLERQAERMLAEMDRRLPAKSLWKAFPIKREGASICLEGSGIVLEGNLAQTMLKDCDAAVVLACTLGLGFEQFLVRTQVRDMARAALADACGSVLVEAGCDRAEQEISARFSGLYLTDRFSPGYGDLPLELQTAISDALGLEKNLGIHVSTGFMMNPTKSVTAILGICSHPVPARIRGCDHCMLKCALSKKGESCHV